MKQDTQAVALVCKETCSGACVHVLVLNISLSCKQIQTFCGYNVHILYICWKTLKLRKLITWALHLKINCLWVRKDKTYPHLHNRKPGWVHFTVWPTIVMLLSWKQTLIGGKKNAVLLPKLIPDTPYTITVAAIYASGESMDISGTGKTSESSSLPLSEFFFLSQ